MKTETETIYEICEHFAGGRIAPLPWRRGQRRRFKTAAEAVLALQSHLHPEDGGTYTVEESRMQFGVAETRSRHASVSLPTERVLGRRVVAHAAPLPAGSLGVTIGVLSFTVEGMGAEAVAAGMQIGDRISRVGAYPIEDMVDLRHALARYNPGEIVSVEVERGGRCLTLALRLGEGARCGRYALTVARGVSVPPLKRFERVTVADQIAVPARPLRSRRR